MSSLVSYLLTSLLTVLFALSAGAKSGGSSQSESKNGTTATEYSDGKCHDKNATVVKCPGSRRFKYEYIIIAAGFFVVLLIIAFKRQWVRSALQWVTKKEGNQAQDKISQETVPRTDQDIEAVGPLVGEVGTRP